MGISSGMKCTREYRLIAFFRAAVLVVPIVSLVAVGTAQDATSPATQPALRSDGLAAYVGHLEALRQCWQSAAKLVRQGKTDDAIAILENYQLDGLATTWESRHRSLTVALRSNFRGDGGVPALHTPRWYADAECPELAIEAFEVAQRDGIALDFGPSLRLSQCLVEARQYGRAMEILVGLLKDNLADDWQRHLRARIDALNGLSDGQEPPLALLRVYYTRLGGVMWFSKHVHAILAAWQAAPGTYKPTDRDALLVTLFENAQDSKGHELALEHMAAGKETDRATAAGAWLARANLAYVAKDYNYAMGLWQHVEKKYEDTSAWPKAVFNIGLLLKEQGEFHSAIEQFEKLLTAELDDREPGSHIMETYRNYRPRGQWEIGHCLFAIGDYRGALEAYGTTQRKYPFQSWCGNEQAEFEYRYAFYQGLCHEHLGQWDQAVESYFRAVNVLLHFDPTAHLRLVDMYEATGQLADLLDRLEQMDREFASRVKPSNRHNARWPSRTMTSIINLRYPSLERRPHASPDRLDGNEPLPELRRGDGRSAHDLLTRLKGTGAGPEDYRERKTSWEAVEAARLLAKRPNEAVPVLAKALMPPKANKWIYYALGRCRTPEAVTLLKESAAKETNINWARSVVYSLMLAGPAGQEAIDELSKDPHYNLKVAIDQARSGQLGEHDKDIAFPPISPGTVLPKGPSASTQPTRMNAQETAKAFISAVLAEDNKTAVALAGHQEWIGQAVPGLRKTIGRQKLTNWQSLFGHAGSESRVMCVFWPAITSAKTIRGVTAEGGNTGYLTVFVDGSDQHGWRISDVDLIPSDVLTQQTQKFGRDFNVMQSYALDLPESVGQVLDNLPVLIESSLTSNRPQAGATFWVTAPDGTPLRGILYAESGGNSALWLRTDEQSRPIWISAGGRLAVFDAIQQKVHIVPTPRTPRLHLAQGDRDIDLEFAVDRCSGPALRLDVASILKTLTDRTMGYEDGELLIGGKSPTGKEVSARLQNVGDHNGPYRLTGLTIRDLGKTVAKIEMRYSALNDNAFKIPLTPDAMYPDGQVVERSLPESPTQAAREIETLLATAMRSARLSLKVNQPPERRTKLEKELGLTVDWAAMETFNCHAAEIIRRPFPTTRPTAQESAPPTTQPADLEVTRAALAKAVGGKWELGPHNAFHLPTRILRGRVYAEPGHVHVEYNVFPFASDDKEQRQQVSRTYAVANLSQVRIIGVNRHCMVLELTGNRTAAARYTKAIVEALRLSPPDITLKAFRRDVASDQQ